MKIGFIGLGHMGNPMARNLLKHGHALKIYDVVPELVKKLATEGCEIATSAADCAKGVEVVITMLPSSPHVRSVYLGEYGVLKGAAGLQRYLDVPVQGLWRDRLLPDGTFVDEPAPGSSLYHIVSAVSALDAACRK